MESLSEEVIVQLAMGFDDYKDFIRFKNINARNHRILSDPYVQEKWKKQHYQGDIVRKQDIEEIVNLMIDLFLTPSVKIIDVREELIITGAFLNVYIKLKDKNIEYLVIVPFRYGKVDGLVKINRDGQLFATLMFQQGQLNGKVVQYDEMGRVEKKQYWKNNRFLKS